MDLKEYSPAFLRVSLGFVLAFLGFMKLTNPVAKKTVVDTITTTGLLPFNVSDFVVYQTLAELVLGLLLIIGLFTRLAALIVVASLLLYGAAVSLFVPNGFSEIVWKDIALLGAAVFIWLNGSGKFDLDSRLGRE